MIYVWYYSVLLIIFL